MSKKILIILSLMLFVISCSNENKTGNGGTGSGDNDYGIASSGSIEFDAAKGIGQFAGTYSNYVVNDNFSRFVIIDNTGKVILKEVQDEDVTSKIKHDGSTTPKYYYKKYSSVEVYLTFYKKGLVMEEHNPDGIFDIEYLKIQ